MSDREMRSYRGLTKDGKWVYGFLISLNRIMVWDKEVCMRSESFEVLPETVGQQTGLQDKNGKEEVYQNDLMKDLLHAYRVTWDKENARWLLIDINEPKNRFKGHAISLLTKVGNIHSDPDLLEK